MIVSLRKFLHVYKDFKMNKVVGLVVLLALVVGGYFTVPFFIGSAPTEKFVAPEGISQGTSQGSSQVIKKNTKEDGEVKNPHIASNKENFPELNRLREAVEKDDTNLQLLVELAENLKGKVIATRDKNLIFELIDILNKILIVDEKNSFALLELANITFESKVFSKASEYYQRYLEINPEDNVIRTRYASSLIFLQKIDAALAEVNHVLKSEPENFAALSYKAIAYAEQGDKEKALKIGESALVVAPTPEVKERFASYLETLVKKDLKMANDKLDNQSQLETYLTTNQVTAVKFVRLEAKGRELLIYLKDFPMAQMPEFAKQKFFSSLKANLEKDQANGLYADITKLGFIDQASQTELDSLDIN